MDGKSLTAVKRKKLRHIRSFRALKITNQFKSLRAGSSYENDAELVVPANRISRRQTSA